MFLPSKGWFFAVIFCNIKPPRIEGVKMDKPSKLWKLANGREHDIYTSNGANIEAIVLDNFSNKSLGKSATQDNHTSAQINMLFLCCSEGLHQPWS